MERRDFLQFIGVEAAGLAVGSAGIVDRILTPTPPREANSSDSFSNVAYNLNYRFRSTSLLAVGFGTFFGGIGAFFAARMIYRSEQVQNPQTS